MKILTFIISLILLSTPAYSQSGWIKCTGMIEVEHGWMLKNPNIVKERGRQCLAAASTSAQSNIEEYYYNSSEKPFAKWTMSNGLSELIKSNIMNIKRSLSSKLIKIKDLGFRQIRTNDGRGAVTVWEAEIQQNLKAIELQTIANIKLNSSKFSSFEKINLDNISVHEVAEINELIGRIAFDLAVIDVLMNMRQYTEQYGRVIKFKHGAMNYTPIKTTPAECISAITMMDQFLINAPRRIKNWTKYSIGSGVESGTRNLFVNISFDGRIIRSENTNAKMISVNNPTTNTGVQKNNEELKSKDDVAEMTFAQMKVIYQPPSPKYPSQALMGRIQGTVVVEVMVGSDGVPLSAIAVDGPIQFIQVSEDYAMKWRFQPALLDGVPRRARFKLVLPFRL